jgi:hypothetical protein
MMIYEKPGYIQVSYHADKNFILFDWTDFGVTLDDIRELHEKALAAVQEKRCYYYIAETSKVTTALSPEVVQWWKDVWVARLVSAGLRAIVTVVPSANVSSRSTREWQVDTLGGILMKNVDSFEEALATIKEFQWISDASRP